MTKTRSQMKGKSLLGEIPRFPKRVATKKSNTTTTTKPKPTTTKKNNTTKTKKRHLSYARMVRETLSTMSRTSTTSSKAVSNQAIGRYLCSHFEVEVVNQNHLNKVLQQGVESGALRKVRRSFLLTSKKKTTFGVSSPTKKKRLAQPSSSSPSSSPSPSPSPSTPQPPTKRRKVSTPKKKRSSTTTTPSTPSPSPSPSPVSTPVPVVTPAKTSCSGFPTLGEEVIVGMVGVPSSTSPSSVGGKKTNGLELTLDMEKNMLAFDKEAMMTGIASLEAKKGGVAMGRPPCDIVAVVDRSVSMSGAKLMLVKEALCYLVSQLGSGDRLSVVSFDHDVYDVFGLRACSEEGRRQWWNILIIIRKCKREE